MIELRVLNNLTAQIMTPLTSKVLEKVVNDCSYEVEGFNFSPQYQAGFWDGRKELFSRTTQKFPLGLFSIVVKVLKTHNLLYTLKDHRIRPKYSIRPIKIPGVLLRPYQESTIRRCLLVTRGIIQAATGSGKSLMILGLCQALADLRINIYVHRTTLLRQLELAFKISGIPVGFLGEGERTIQKINLCSFQTILKKQKISLREAIFSKENIKIMRDADVMIIDETHHLSAETFFKVHSFSTNSYLRFGLSATPFRDDGSDLLIQAATGKRIVKLNASELIRQGYLVKPTIFFLKIPSMPGLAKNYREVYNKAVIENDLRNELIAEIVEIFVKKNLTCLVAVKEVRHGQEIMKKITSLLPDVPIRFIQGETGTGKEKLAVLEELNQKRLKIVVATTVFGEGVDVPSLSCLINAKAAISAVDTLQLCGRVLRPCRGKTKAYIIDLADQTTPYLRSHSRKRRGIINTEELFNAQEISSLAELKISVENG